MIGPGQGCGGKTKCHTSFAARGHPDGGWLLFISKKTIETSLLEPMFTSKIAGREGFDKTVNYLYDVNIKNLNG